MYKVDVEYVEQGFERENTVVIAVEDGGKVSSFAVAFYLEKLHKPGNFVNLVHVQSVHENIIVGADGNVNPGAAVMPHLGHKEFPQFLRNLSSELKAKHISHKILREFGDEGSSICTAAGREKADYVVVGCKGHGAVKEFFKGTITGHVSHHCKVPVVIARSVNCLEHSASVKDQHKPNRKEHARDFDRALSNPS